MPLDYPEVESLARLARACMVVGEAPVQMHPRAGGVSSITPLRAVYYMAKVTLGLALTPLSR